MTPYYDEAGITIYHGDCVEVLPRLPVKVSAVVTSPPYADQRAGLYEGIPEADYDRFTVTWNGCRPRRLGSRWFRPGQHS
jgi:DNA modification methylase